MAETPLHVVVPAGGIGGARFLRGLLAAFAGGNTAAEQVSVTVIGNRRLVTVVL